MGYNFLSNLSRILVPVKTQTKASEPFEKTYLEDLAIVSKTIKPDHAGRIYFQASWWPAVCAHNVVLISGTKARVIGMKNITYIVEPLHRVSNDQN